MQRERERNRGREGESGRKEGRSTTNPKQRQREIEKERATKAERERERDAQVAYFPLGFRLLGAHSKALNTQECSTQLRDFYEFMLWGKMCEARTSS